MNEFTAAGLLGLVQGLTEFLPVSSSGHLIIASSLLGLEGERIKTFEIAIQLGSILAVVALYRKRFLDLARFRSGSSFSGVRGLFLLFLTCLPACVAGFFLHGLIKKYLFNPVSVAIALAAGALFILFVEARLSRTATPPRVNSLERVTPRLAFGIGCFQCLSLWPGFSRSTATIMGGTLLGAGRAVAAEYSFIAAVPIMAAATGFSLIADAGSLSLSDIPFFAVGACMAFVSALLAIKVFVSLISKFSFRPFAWYRLIVSPLILWLWT